MEPTKGICYLATGSRRYKVTFTGNGGHSWLEFGLPSAIHAMGRAIAKISDVSVPKNPKTTFNVEVVHGGTSVNTIAAEATLLIDLRSTSEDALIHLEDTILPLFEEAAREESARWNDKSSIRVTINKIGDRPAGTQKMDAKIVQTAVMAAKTIEGMPELLGPMSSNGN